VWVVWVFVGGGLWVCLYVGVVWGADNERGDGKGEVTIRHGAHVFFVGVVEGS